MGHELGTFTPPVMIKFPSEVDQGPWITSNTKGRLVLTRRDQDGLIGQAFTECPLEQEDAILLELFQTIVSFRNNFKWGNVCPTIEEASNRMVQFGLEPRTLIVPFCTLNEIVGLDLSPEEAEMLTLTKGCVAEVEGVRVLSAREALPAGHAILGTLPALVGMYTRIYDHLALTFTQANKAIILVSPNVAR